MLLENFGRSYGAWLHEAAHGRDERPVVTFSEPKSISRETTFERDLHAVRDRAELREIFTDLCVRLAGDLERKGYASKTIGIKLRFDDFKSVTRDLTLPDAHHGCTRHPPRSGGMPETGGTQAKTASAGRARGDPCQDVDSGRRRVCGRESICESRRPGIGL